MVECCGQRRLSRSPVPSRRRILLGFDPQPPTDGIGGRPRRKGAHAGDRLPFGARASVPRGSRRCAGRMVLSPPNGNCGRPHCDRRRQRWGWPHGRTDQLPQRDGRGCAWLVSPWVDLTMSGSMLTSKDTVDPLIHKTYLEELAAAYVPAEINRADPRVSPVFADLTGFPPMLIQVGSAETLLADATRFATAAGIADAAVTLEVWPHMIHAWHLCNAHLDAGRHALASAGRFIRAHL